VTPADCLRLNHTVMRLHRTFTVAYVIRTLLGAISLQSLLQKIIFFNLERNTRVWMSQFVAVYFVT